ncbi:GAP family protein [Streptomyces sp. NPDC054904]|uniref:GAP family protein n=1 Tax=unclassified Streptomyces TaxID=2593676 RepID=UPI002481E8F5|nr:MULTISPECIES: GAP family protein [unclassified Streptomyces]MDA5282059.1 GAP family protein [Streptomyces sp. Isolate_45]MDX2389454.1 GAP family protein [Streptomyces sp. DK15]
MLLDLAVIGTAITLGPLHNSAFILLLSSRRGVRTGLAFVVSWLANLVTVIACVLLLTGGEPPARHSAPSTGVACVKLSIGIGMVLYGAHRFRRPSRPHGPPRWTARVDNASWATAAGLAWLLQPWALVGAGAATVVAADLSSLTDWLALAGYCLLATLSLIVMETYGVLAPAAADAKLNALRTWLGHHQEQLIVTLSILAGLWLMGRGIYELTV